MRVRKIPISDIMLARSIIRPGRYRIETDLPPDTEVYGVTHDPRSNQFYFFVTSSTFENIPEGAVPEDLLVTFTRTQDAKG